GCHFERVPGYHLVVLRDLFEIRTLLERNRTVPSWLDGAVRRMIAFLVSITGPADRLPLFKDTTRNDDFAPSDFLRADGWYAALCKTTVDPPPAAVDGLVFGPSGYAIVRDGRHLLVADYGIPCPDYLPAHAHADLFSFELTRDGAPLVVDSGVFAYQGEWRPWFRSTAAHNTVEVAEENQSEVWGRFRVARRAKPERVQTVSNGGVHVMQGEHRGYARLTPAVTHRRTMLWSDGALVVVDELFGDGRTRAKSRLHLHPAVTALEIEVTPFGPVAATRERGWYSERFGSKTENDVLVFAADGALPLVFGYCVASPGAASAILTRDGDAPRIELRHAGRTITLQLPRNAPPLIA
ncbi:MAG TPA: alginate lyase family protein, partial [Thermoanaerobaculia bacterium]